MKLNHQIKTLIPLPIVAALLLQLCFPLLSHAMATSTTEAAPDVVVEVLGDDIKEVEEEETEDEEVVEDEEPEEETEFETDATINTGDALATSEIENNVNHNEVETTVATSTPEDTEGSHSSSTPETASSTEEVVELDPVEVELENDAHVDNTSTTTAATGGNPAGGKKATINTGDAVAYTDVLNVVNTNIIDSNGLIDFINDTLGYQDFDLTDEFELVFDSFDTAVSTDPCSYVCGDTDLEVSATNTADIHNDITVIADTGGNTASGGTANINTGDAYASANVINVANTNITDSNYLLLVFNNFADYTGDIVLPSSGFFTEHILRGNSVVPDVSIDNNAAVTNNTTAVADTGNNEAAGGSIETGNAVAHSDTSNFVNQNMIGGGSFNMLIRVHGDWSGSISGLPDGLTWRETDRGIEIMGEAEAARTAQTPKVAIHNTASVRNDVQVYALSGDNKADGESTNINTGDAYADSSVMNIVNTNVISSNWTNLIFTIFGDWSGDLAFGQPDLWLGIQAESEDNPIMPGSYVDYTFTIFNHGDVTARGVQLDSLFDGSALQFANSASGWDIGDLRSGETREVRYRAKVSDMMPKSGVSAIPLTAMVTSENEDADESDNEDVATVYVGRERSSSADESRPRFQSNFSIEKTASQSTAAVGDVVGYSISLFNHGGQLYDAMLVDTLFGPDGEVLLEQSWPLGEVKNWETINVGYELQFDETFEPGVYLNQAQIIGFHGNDRKMYQTPYESEVAEAVVQFGPQQLVLGASTCPSYLTEYMRYGKVNTPSEVEKLQIFLIEHMDADVEVSGFFDLKTEIAVRDFQQRYRDEVLEPWGLFQDTGFVYFTTQKKINEIMCEGMNSFPLTMEQKAEIEWYKNTMAISLARIRRD
tara:strand:- start:3754 stop:6405 length:2652 start_codon:yes stop_codon:yes gene_type:complete